MLNKGNQTIVFQFILRLLSNIGINEIVFYPKKKKVFCKIIHFPKIIMLFFFLYGFHVFHVWLFKKIMGQKKIIF